ncbi:MAG: PHP domain protein [bacterium ADurb.Bin212]|nr:MAG: PHP domain protein [bacterium ADurb.Bin212]
MDIDINKYSPSRIIKAISPRVKLGRADLHIHSNYSDGKPGIEEILEYVQYKTDLNVIAITDHDTIEGAVLAKGLAKSKAYRFEVIVGEEISCLEGHLLALYIKEAIKPNQSVSEAIKEVRAQGGISIAAHPFYHTRLKNDHMVVMNGIGAKELIANHHGLDAIEIVNSTPTLADENLAASFINRTLLFRAETGSSDAHILDAIGRGYTIFEGKTSDDLRHAIKHQQTQAMYRGWSVLAALKYLWFFIPKGFRLLWSNTIRFHEK